MQTVVIFFYTLLQVVRKIGLHALYFCRAGRGGGYGLSGR